MPIDVTKISEKNLVIFKVIGKVSAQEITGVIEDFSQQNPESNVIWDIQEGDLSHITDHNARNFISQTLSYISKRKEAKTAIVDKHSQLRLVTDVTTYAEILRPSNTIGVCHSLEEAYNWIGTQP